ncbi:hypothetical protein RB653_001480 [Dictyostelium firmibasis]|uniref:Uncharacterized protein n=1 Tax=Dictyostelium firmibasis TaxID=79012 RepID=A0AAN7TYL9_9MYCE
MAKLELNNNTLNNSNNNTTNNNNTINTIVSINKNDNHLTPPPANPKYSGLQKKGLMNQRLHGRKFFDSADWALGNSMDNDYFQQPLLNAALISTSSNKAH